MLGSMPLDPLYTFETFIIGKSNRLPFAAAQGVAENPGKTYNPLYLYGTVGLGKTHLLHAIAQMALAQGLAVLYIPAETFRIDLNWGIDHHSMEEFRNKYRTADVFLVDDIQIFDRYPGVVDEFVNTFNALIDQGKQIAVTSDRHPKDGTSLEARLRSRFEGGMMADVRPPEFSLRRAILLSKPLFKERNIEYEAVDFIARRIKSNVRELVGTAATMLHYAEEEFGALTFETAHKVLRHVAPQIVRPPTTMADVVREVSQYYNLTEDDLRGKGRDKRTSTARQIAMYLMRHDAEVNAEAIAGELGGRDHTTINYGLEKIQTLLAGSSPIKGEVDMIRDILHQ